jgi:hypothetical protein
MIELIEKILLPILIAVITYLLLNRLDEWRKRRNESILGMVILDSLKEEIKTGIEIINSTLNSEDYMDPRNPPRASWTGMNTIPDDVLLRIISATKNVNPIGFHPKEIRIHCKNYFIHMLANWDEARNTKVFTPQAYIKLNFSRYGEAAKKVLDMIEQTREILQQNSKKLFPK